MNVVRLCCEDFTKPSYLCIADNLVEKIFTSYSIGQHNIIMLYAIFNTGRKVSMIKIFQREQVVKLVKLLLTVYYR